MESLLTAGKCSVRGVHSGPQETIPHNSGAGLTWRRNPPSCKDGEIRLGIGAAMFINTIIPDIYFLWVALNRPNTTWSSITT